MELDGDRPQAHLARGYVVLRPDRPTDAWRTCRADAIGALGLHRMKAAVAAAAPGGDARWRLAAAGDAATAIGVALDMMRGPVAGTRFDDAMTAVAVCALEGDAAACLVTSYVIRRLPLAGRAEARLATSWLLRAFDGLRARHAPTVPRPGSSVS